MTQDSLMTASTPALDIEKPLDALPRSQRGDWTWELVAEFPRQGEWTTEQYLGREFEGLVEYVDGVLDFLPTPKLSHQFLVDFLHDLLKQFVRSRQLGITAFAPLRVKVAEDCYREPDIVFARNQHVSSLDEPLNGAALVMEVVSGSGKDRQRDLVEKRQDYAEAGIPEYWIVDPERQMITVLTLADGAREYAVHGEFRSGQWATSLLLTEFAVDVAACFAAGSGGAA